MNEGRIDYPLNPECIMFETDDEITTLDDIMAELEIDSLEMVD